MGAKHKGELAKGGLCFCKAKAWGEGRLVALLALSRAIPEY